MTSRSCSPFLDFCAGLSPCRRHSAAVVLVVWTLLLGGGVYAQDGCVWQDGSGGVINLISLGNTDGTPRFKDVQGSIGSSPWYYSFNPCFPFSEGDCSGASVCQTDEGHTQYFTCGLTNSAEVATDDGKPAVKYTAQGSDILRISHVALQCDQSATTPSLEAIGDTGNGDYHFVLTSVCACPNGCADGGGTVEATISGGTVLLIVVLVAAVVYLIGGVVYNKTRHQKSGAEIIPNVTFWKALPGAIKDGFKFTCSKLRGKSAEYDKV